VPEECRRAFSDLYYAQRSENLFVEAEGRRRAVMRHLEGILHESGIFDGDFRPTNIKTRQGSWTSLCMTKVSFMIFGVMRINIWNAVFVKCIILSWECCDSIQGCGGNLIPLGRQRKSPQLPGFSPGFATNLISFLNFCWHSEDPRPLWIYQQARPLAKSFVPARSRSNSRVSRACS